MKLTPLILLTTILLSCGTPKSSTTDNTTPSDTTHTTTDDLQNGTLKNHNISITITHYTPWCGGMAPTPEMEANQTQPRRNHSFILLDLIADSKTKVKTDSTGTIYLNLPPGKYAIREKYKDCSLEEFKKQNAITPNEFYQESGGEDCYEKWWAANLGEFEILADDPPQHFDYYTSDRCFTGNNPCMVYTGPYPP